MPGNLLTVASVIQCPHGGQAVLSTSNSKAMSDGALVLLETDVHSVIGCPFTVGSKYSPCVQIRWSGGAMQASVEGVSALVQSSIGLCHNAENAPQGVALIASTQAKVAAQ